MSNSMTIRWCYDNKRWTETLTVDLGDVGQTDVSKVLWRSAPFRTKQLEVVVTDGTPFVLKAIDDDVEVIP